MNKILKSFYLVIFTLSLFAFTGCGDDHMDDTADNLGDAAENVGDDLGEATEEVSETIEDATD